ncbi:hypothetical protein Tco_0517305 [Tanacetum coccineum]
MYVDGGSSSKILYEHCFNRFRPEVRNQMIPATTPLVRFSGEIIWPLGKYCCRKRSVHEKNTHLFPMDEFHGGKVTLSLQWNYREARGKENLCSSIYGPQNAKIPSDRRNGHTTDSSRIIPLECTMVSGPGVPQPVINQVTEEKIQLAVTPWNVKKHDGSWRMCVDFTDLNKVCPKDATATGNRLEGFDSQL